jgi:hypothetical protein
MSEQNILGTKDLVPIAERPFGPVDTEETVEETVWYNPTDHDVVLDLYVGIQPNLKRFVLSGRKLTWEQRTGKRRYIIKAKTHRAIPSEFDQGIQQMQCMEAEHSQRPFDCRDRTHRKMIVGGLAPHSLVKGGMQHRPVVSQALVDSYAKEQKLKDAIATGLIEKSKKDLELQDAQRELEQLRAEKARLEQQLGQAASPDVVESVTRSQQAGIRATESRIEGIKDAAARPTRGQKRAALAEPPPEDDEE